MTEKFIPDYIFETSWEVCNKVGGIYTVLSTRANILKQRHGDNLIFIGPDVLKSANNPYFTESDSLLSDWKSFVRTKYGLSIRIGHWNVPGNPIAVLVDFTPLITNKNEIYGEIWKQVGVNSLYGYDDYDESSMFGYAAGMMVESYYLHFKLSSKEKVIAHFNEWQTSFGIFYLKENLPNIATIFTTHATSIGRSIAGNNKPLYDYLTEYNGDQMAEELNMISKHSTEKVAAHFADCFTTVSDITAKECKQLLEKEPDIVTPNGFEDDFVPKKGDYIKKRKDARDILRKVSETLLGYNLSEDALFIGTSGRYEYKNKGIDVFIDSLKKLSTKELDREIIAFLIVPAHSLGARLDLAYSLENKDISLQSWNRFTTHELYDYQNDSIMNAIRYHNFNNAPEDKIKIVYIPSYINGADGIFNKDYYDLLIGLDMTVFPSYYEPWGYTPLESTAFAIPTITTDLSGFGQWVCAGDQNIIEGIGVIHRSDYNFSEVSESLAEMILFFARSNESEVKKMKELSRTISQKALWEHFIQHYEKAYSIALSKNQK